MLFITLIAQVKVLARGAAPRGAQIYWLGIQQVDDNFCAAIAGEFKPSRLAPVPVPCLFGYCPGQFA